VTTSACFYNGGTGKGGGYTFNYGDNSGGACPGSTSCVNPANLCTTGATVAHGTSYACYGNGFGVNLYQTSGGGDAGAVTSTAAGLTWALTGTVPPNGVQISITAPSGPCSSANNGCCVQVTTTLTSGTSTTTPWSSFKPYCYLADAGGGFTPTDGLNQIQFQALSGTTTQTYDYCVTTLTY
jgi:hypothetical protein